MVDIPLVALQTQTPVVNGAANFIQGAAAKSDLDTQKLQQAQASIGMMGSIALGAMGGNINAPAADPAKWQQGVNLLKAHGIDMSQYGPDFAPTLARASVGTLGQLQQATNQRDFELQLAQFANALKMQNRPVPVQPGSIMADPNTGQPLPGQSMLGIGFSQGAPPANTSIPSAGDIGLASQPTTQTAGPVGMPVKSATPAAAPVAGPAMGNLPAVPLGPDGTPDKQAQAQFLKGLDPAVGTIVQQVANYEADPSKVASLRGNQRTMIDALAKMYNPTYDASNYAARAAYLKNIKSGTYAQNINSANVTIDHLNQLAGNATDLQNTNFPMWNSIANTFKTETGNSATTNFDVNAKAAGDELAKFFKGTGATDVGSIEQWHSSLSKDASPEQQKGAVDTAIGLLKSRLDVLRQQYEQNMGQPAPYSQFLYPDTVKTLVRMGYDPDTLERTDQSGAAAGSPALDNLKSKYGLN